MVVEYCHHGNLRDFLRSHRPSQEGYYGSETSAESTQESPLSLAQLVSFSYQVARGMEYLSSNKVRNDTNGNDEECESFV